MATKLFTIGGTQYQGNFNANHELSQSVTGLDDKVLIEYPRERLCNNGIPIIKDDLGTELRLGYHFMTESEKEKQKAYKKGLNTGAGSGTPKAKVPQIPLTVIQDVLKQKGLSKETRELFETMEKELQAEKTKKMEQLKALMSGFSAEELKALLG